MSAQLHQLLEQLTSVFRASLREAATKHGLKLVQLEALVYLSMANRYSDIPRALSDYLGVTKGTVSQTLKALSERGLIEKKADADDGRLLHCKLTAQGRAIVKTSYPTSALSQLSANTVDVATPALTLLLRQIQQDRGFRTFGVCHSCRHFQKAERGGNCGLTNERLTISDTTKICREHEQPAKTD